MSNPDCFWNCSGVIVVNVEECPNSEDCSTLTCEYCNTMYCSVHDVHCTGIYTHGENANQPETTHVHCTNNADLLSQWRSQIEGTCPDCGKFICKLCPHSCLDMPCPNGRYCVKETCSTCGGLYCSRHMMHICANFTEMSQNTGNDNFSVQTTITGQAVVHVNIQDNSTGGGSNVDLSSTNSLLGQIESNTRPLSGKLDDLKAAINTQTSQLNNKLDGVNNSIQNQTTELSGKMNDVKNSVNDVKDSVDDVKESIENQTTDLSNKLDSLETAVSDMSIQNHGDLDTWGSAIDGKLGDIGEKLDNLELDGDLNVNLGGLEGKVESTNTKLDTIINGNGNLGLGSVGTASPATGVVSELVENELTGKEIDNVQKVEYFTAIKNKLLPPRLEIGSYDACFSFDIPTVFGEPLHLTLDFNDEKLRAVRLAVRSFSSVLMILVFMFGILRMIRQY